LNELLIISGRNPNASLKPDRQDATVQSSWMLLLTSSPDAAASFDNMARYHKMTLSEREAWMPNWPLNMEVV